MESLCPLLCLSGLKHRLKVVASSVPAQDVDDVTRVSEAVAKVVVFALKGASSGDNADDWLNPTEVALKRKPPITSLTLC